MKASYSPFRSLTYSNSAILSLASYMRSSSLFFSVWKAYIKFVLVLSLLCIFSLSYSFFSIASFAPWNMSAFSFNSSKVSVIFIRMDPSLSDKSLFKSLRPTFSFSRSWTWFYKGVNWELNASTFILYSIFCTSNFCAYLRLKLAVCVN